MLGLVIGKIKEKLSLSRGTILATRVKMSIPRKEELSFRVLLYKEDGEWTAHALELDLIGSGESEDSALADLHKAVGCQISFAIQKKDISMLSREVPKEYFVRWKESRASCGTDSTAKAMERSWDLFGQTNRRSSIQPWDRVDQAPGYSIACPRSGPNGLAPSRPIPGE